MGQEPDGINFTGLRADYGGHGYLLLFRESSPMSSFSFEIPPLEGKKLTRLAGTAEGRVSGCAVCFTAAQARSFGLFRYE